MSLTYTICVRLISRRTKHKSIPGDLQDSTAIQANQPQDGYFNLIDKMAEDLKALRGLLLGIRTPDTLRRPKKRTKTPRPQGRRTKQPFEANTGWANQRPVVSQPVPCPASRSPSRSRRGTRAVHLYSNLVRCHDGADRAWNRSMMLFPPCPLTAQDRHQGNLISPVKRGIIVTVGPLSPSCRAVLGRPARHPDIPQMERTRLGQPATGRPPHCNPRVLAYIKGPRASLVISLAILHLSRRAG